MKNKETADAVLKAMREICRQRGLCCATTKEIVAHTGLSKRVVVAAIAALRCKRASNADKVFETTYADADAGSSAITYGWTLEELWKDGDAMMRRNRRPVRGAFSAAPRRASRKGEVRNAVAKRRSTVMRCPTRTRGSGISPDPQDGSGNLPLDVAYMRQIVASHGVDKVKLCLDHVARSDYWGADPKGKFDGV